jgi:hypothetical protein
MKIEIYDNNTIHDLRWPETEDGSYARRHLVPLIKNGVGAYIQNVQAECMALQAGNIVMPLVVSQATSQSSWVCSPTTQYIDYGQEYTTLISNPLLASFVKTALKAMGKFAASCRLNSVVYVNNWLFAVDLFPKNFTEEHLCAITQSLLHRFPQHAIIFRSLNPLINQPLMKLFKRNGYKMMASRYIHITDAADESILRTRILKSDQKLMRESTFRVVDETEILPEDYAAILKLYTSLYIVQHSKKNPQLTEKYIKSLIDNKLLQFKILKDQQHIRGIAGYVERNGVLLCPFFGYEKKDEDRNVIYRLLSTSLLLEAHKRKLIFHQSAGASFYKTIRRAKSCYEYNAIYTRHLPLNQRGGWMALKNFINTVAPPFMKKY